MRNYFFKKLFNDQTGHKSQKGKGGIWGKKKEVKGAYSITTKNSENSEFAGFFSPPALFGLDPYHGGGRWWVSELIRSRTGARFNPYTYVLRQRSPYLLFRDDAWATTFTLSITRDQSPHFGLLRHLRSRHPSLSRSRMYSSRLFSSPLIWDINNVFSLLS